MKLEQISFEEFEKLKAQYNKENTSYKHKYLYRVGADGGFYSEIDAMMEAMLYCHENQLRFVLCSDYANFSGGGNGWEEFFVPFTDMDHHRLNKIVNRRYGRNHLCARILEGMLIGVLKLQSGAKYVTSELFFEYCMNPFYQKETKKWDLFGIDGQAYYEFSKIRKLAMRYNDKTLDEINSVISEVDLSGPFMSVQIRGGDKNTEAIRLFTCEDVAYSVRLYNTDNIEKLFVFTDDYKNVEKIRQLLPEMKIFTTATLQDSGYDNTSFNSAPWEYRRNKLIRLFAAVEICIMSNFHVLDPTANPSTLIRSVKENKNCGEMQFK